MVLVPLCRGRTGPTIEAGQILSVGAILPMDLSMKSSIYCLQRHKR